MSGVNKVILVGRLGNKPETKVINNGNTVTSFSVATSQEWKDQAGVKQEKVEWSKVVAWGKLAEVCAKYLDKGRQVYVEGRLDTTSYEKEGQKHYSTQIVANAVQFLGSSPQASDSAPAGGDSGYGTNYSDEIPF